MSSQLRSLKKLTRSVKRSSVFEDEDSPDSKLTSPVKLKDKFLMKQVTDTSDQQNFLPSRQISDKIVEEDQKSMDGSIKDLNSKLNYTMMSKSQANDDGHKPTKNIVNVKRNISYNERLLQNYNMAFKVRKEQRRQDGLM